MSAASGRLAGRVAVVTGGASGIGAAVADRLADEGAAVAVADLDQQRCERAAAELEARGGRALACQTDVTDLEQIRALCQATEQRLGRLDILVNSAGVALGGSIVETTPESWDTVLRVDLTGAFFCMQQAIPAMRRAGGGKVVNIASVAALRGLARRPAYAAAKGGLVTLTQQAAAELATVNIQVNAIAPGVVETPLSSHGDEAVRAMLANVPAGRRASPAEIAAAVAFLASEDAAYVTGVTVPVDGGLTASMIVRAGEFQPMLPSLDDD